MLVRIVATGLCHSDITMSSFLPAEMFPNVFGHEGAGVVEEVGADVAGIEVGDHVVLSLRSCRTCAQCRRATTATASRGLFINYMGMRMDGSTTYTRGGQGVFGSFFGQSSFSQHAIAYADNCIVVDKALDLPRLGPYGCGFQTGVGTMLNAASPSAGESVVVYGAGSVGLSAISAGRTIGVTTVAVDPLAQPPRAGGVVRRPHDRPGRPGRRHGRREGQGADRRRRELRHRHHRGPRGRQGGSAVVGRPRHAVRDRSGR